MMHSVKGGWRPTFALAKQNESDGKKSRIRRSKEERKAMVESFIKKYQESNSGNFPSLNLMHKEVGGSFYTVREIVRDIIQENRVLGPAKFNLEELNTDEFFEQNPLGSIARGPHPFLAAPSNENHPEHNNVADANGKVLSVPDKHYTEAEHQVVDNGHVINVGHVHITNKEPIEATVVSDGCYTGAQDPAVDKGYAVNGSQVDGTTNKSEAPVVSDGYITGAESAIIDKGHDNRHVINVDHVHVTNKEPIKATVVSDGCYTGDQDLVVDKGYVVSDSQVDATNNESVEAPVVSDAYITGAESAMIDTGYGINGTQVVDKDSNEASIPEMQVSKPTAPEQNVEQELVATTMPLAKVNSLTEDLIVETFPPLRSVARTAKGIEGLGELSESSNSLEKDIKTLDLEEGKKSELFGTEPTKNSNLVDEKLEDSLGNKNIKQFSNIVHEKEKDLGDTLAEIATHKEHSGHEYEVRASYQNAVTSETNNHNQIKDGAKTSSQDGFQAKNPSKAYTEGSKPSEEGLHEADRYRVDWRGSNPVERITLGSWDGRSKKSPKQESNPLLALFKAVADAFVKFWSE